MIYDKKICGLTVTLESVRESDAEVTYQMRMDKTKTRYVHKITGTVEDQRNYIVHQNDKPGDYLFLVKNLAGEPIGMRGVYNIHDNEAESGRTIGYGNPYENMEALLLGFDFAFDVLGVDLLHMDAMEENKSIRSIQEKIGAERVRDVYDEELGATLIYSVLKKDVYRNKRPELMSLIEKYQARRLKKEQG